MKNIAYKILNKAVFKLTPPVIEPDCTATSAQPMNAKNIKAKIC